MFLSVGGGKVSSISRPQGTLMGGTYSQITFEVANPQEHYHIPLLISPYSYTTYRGS